MKEYESNEIKDDDRDVFLGENVGLLFPYTTLGCQSKSPRNSLASRVL